MPEILTQRLAVDQGIIHMVVSTLKVSIQTWSEQFDGHIKGWDVVQIIKQVVSGPFRSDF